MSKSSTRKGNGDGSIRQRPDGRWEGRFTAPDGRQKSVYGKTKTACREALKRKQAEVLTGIYVESSRMTVSDWLDLWLKDHCNGLKPTTKMNYTSYVKKHIKPAIGSLALSKLNVLNLQTFFNDLGKTHSVSSVKTIKTTLSSALSCAVRLGLIKENPCPKITTGRREAHEMVIVDRQDFSAFIAATGSVKYGAALLFLLQTGIRSGELRGLRWADIDLEAKTMTVSRQISLGPDGYFIQTPKSDKGRRLALMDETVALLKRHRADQAAQRLASGKWVDNDMTTDLVFRTKHGDHLHAHSLVQPAAKVGEAIGLHGLRPHDLRHSYAVAALRSGIDVKTVQNALGHAKAAMTLDTYAKYTDDMGRTAAKKLSAYWSANSK